MHLSRSTAVGASVGLWLGVAGCGDNSAHPGPPGAKATMSCLRQKHVVAIPSSITNPEQRQVVSAGIKFQVPGGPAGFVAYYTSRSSATAVITAVNSGTHRTFGSFAAGTANIAVVYVQPPSAAARRLVEGCALR